MQLGIFITEDMTANIDKNVYEFTSTIYRSLNLLKFLNNRKNRTKIHE